MSLHHILVLLLLILLGAAHAARPQGDGQMHSLRHWRPLAHQHHQHRHLLNFRERLLDRLGLGQPLEEIPHTVTDNPDLEPNARRKQAAPYPMDEARVSGEGSIAACLCRQVMDTRAASPQPGLHPARSHT